MTTRASLSTAAVAVLVVLAGCAFLPAAPETTDTPTTPPAPATPASGTLEAHFVNVGQSTAVLVVGPTGETMLVDSGGYREDGAEVLAYLDALGVERIDYLVTSHADADHIGGHEAVIEHFETEERGVGAVYDPGYPASTLTYEEYLDAVERHGVTLFETRAGDTIPMAGATVEVLAPPAGGLDGDRNENSLVIRVEYGATALLLTGDAGPTEEAYLVERYGSDLRATVLKAGHHGSATSTGAGLLDAAQPGTVVISSAYDSPYGHPHVETLQRLSERSVPAFWTGVHGDVVVRSNGSAVTVLTRESAPTEPLALRAASGVEPGTGGQFAVRAVIPAGASATPVGTPIPGGQPTPGGATESPGGPLTTPDGGVALELASVHADAAGDDASNLNDEYVVLRNAGSEPLDVSGWTISDAAGHEYTFPPGTTIAAGATVRLHSGSGADTASDLYWGAGSPVWNNAGDTVIVRTAEGQVVLEATY